MRGDRRDTGGIGVGRGERGVRSIRSIVGASLALDDSFVFVLVFLFVFFFTSFRGGDLGSCLALTSWAFCFAIDTCLVVFDIK